MTTVTNFHTEQIGTKTFYFVKLADFDERSSVVTTAISKKEFGRIVKTFKLRTGPVEYTGHSIITAYY